jgi:ABC-type Fe3+/spermidine/putrescine transport system ATPase subunit
MQLELRRLQEHLGTTFIYVTHDQEEALTMSSRIVIMQDGKVMQTGSPREVYDEPASVFASMFIGDTNLLAGEVVHSRDGVVTIAVNGRELRVRESRALSPGTGVALSVRPERVSAVNPESDAGDWNTLSGTVTEVVFLGDRIRARVECEGISLWTQQLPSTPTARRLADKAPATIGWAIDDGRLVLPDAGRGNGTASTG